MLGRFGRWMIDAVVLLFAGYAFAFVPLGERTGLEHLHAVLGSEPARRAGQELMEAGERLRDRIFGEPARTHPGAPTLPELGPRQRPPAQWRLSHAPDAGVDASL